MLKNDLEWMGAVMIPRPVIFAWIERLSDLLQIRERGIPIIVGYMGIPLTKEMQ